MLTSEQKDEVRRKIENWGRWRHSGKVGPRGITGEPYPAYRLVVISDARSDDRNNLILSGEAEDTDRILRKMEPKIRQALEIHYLAPASWTPRIRARACRCHVGTYYRRVEKGCRVFIQLCYSKRVERRIAA